MKIVHILLDETGSMLSMKATAIESYNAYLDQLEGLDLKIALTKFDSTKTELVHKGLIPTEAVRLDADNYQPGAGTPLFDAMAGVMASSEIMAKEADMEKTPDSHVDVLIVVLTDGQENASREHTLETINTLIKEREEMWGWNFLYLGTSPEAWANESAFIGAAMASNTLQSTGKRGYAEASSVAAAVTTDYAESPLGTKISVTAEQKEAVRSASDEEQKNSG